MRSTWAYLGADAAITPLPTVIGLPSKAAPTPKPARRPSAQAIRRSVVIKAAHAHLAANPVIEFGGLFQIVVVPTVT